MTVNAVTRLQARTGVPTRLTSAISKKASPLKHDRYPQQARLPPSQQIIKTKSIVYPAQQRQKELNVTTEANSHPQCTPIYNKQAGRQKPRQSPQQHDSTRQSVLESSDRAVHTEASASISGIGTLAAPCPEKRFNWWINEKNTVHAKAKLAESFVQLQGNFSYAREDGLKKLKHALSEPTEVGRKILALQDLDIYNIVKHLHVSIFERWENSRGLTHKNCRVSVAELVLSLKLLEGAVLLHPESREYVNIELMARFIKGKESLPGAANAHLHKHGLAVLVATLINCTLSQFKRFQAEAGIDSVATSVGYTGQMEREIRLHAWELITIMNNEQSDLNTRIAMRRILEKRFGRSMLESAVRNAQFYT
ncbi:hypothetical protein SARC_01721 [Sphaeroforma arctica JP610]|uniref:Uncharacterized protein n=1 Tax=Sphaeroforma arctica JP610 TaxID=667725 RepID=A0A0L0GAV0_9EUKA|nr:hypothetical protein SARC_01721 [Sphaeroforma arctica JP610]KNC86105.1 hypothetical protein SARC_01721 [Sphaeroforma arctica JP610]|eukprot:XP_014160007.1 hypothetical protein SARC_01721 [Sphaeroforma arctica JP610]